MTNEPRSLEQTLNSETAKIEWRELQRFFASGCLVVADSSLDLITTAQHIASDNVQVIEKLTQSKQLSKPTDSQAKTWFASNQIFWAVVIKPFVLIQQVQP